MVVAERDFIALRATRGEAKGQGEEGGQRHSIVLAPIAIFRVAWICVAYFHKILEHGKTYVFVLGHTRRFGITQENLRRCAMLIGVRYGNAR